MSGFLYTLEENRIVVYYENITAPHAIAFMQERIKQFGKIYTQVDPITDYDSCNSLPVYYTVNDSLDLLSPFYDKVRVIKGLRAEFYRDVYDRDKWFLELLSERASKAHATEYIKEKYGFDRIVAFGDNINDLPLFKVSDHKLAVENAHDDVKSKADEIINSNTKDGVARWLKENYYQFV